MDIPPTKKMDIKNIILEVDIDNQTVQKKAIETLSSGKEKFNSTKKKSVMEEGYRIFLLGIDL